MAILLLLGVILLLALIMRFIQPQLLYGLREVVTLVAVNKAFLDYSEGRSSPGNSWRKQLRKGWRFEFSGADEEYALERVVKIRELYRLLDPERSGVADGPIEKQPQVCIIELADLISNLGRQMRIREEYVRPCILANDILSVIGSKVREAEGDPPIKPGKAVEEWFTSNPMSIEQAIELLIAVVFGIAYRQREERIVKAGPVRGEFVNFWEASGRVEKRLRSLVRKVYLGTYMDEAVLQAKILSFLGHKTYEECCRRMRKRLGASSDTESDIFDFLYLGELEVLCFRLWNKFKGVFPEKSWLKERLGKIAAVRNEVAHHRNIAIEIRQLAVGYCYEVEVRVDEALKRGQLAGGPQRSTCTVEDISVGD